MTDPSLEGFFLSEEQQLVDLCWQESWRRGSLNIALGLASNILNPILQVLDFKCSVALID